MLICESGKCFCKYDNKVVNFFCFGMYIVYIYLVIDVYGLVKMFVKCFFIFVLRKIEISLE